MGYEKCGELRKFCGNFAKSGLVGMEEATDKPDQINIERMRQKMRRKKRCQKNTICGQLASGINHTTAAAIASR
jgi:hypothetical protein